MVRRAAGFGGDIANTWMGAQEQQKKQKEKENSDQEKLRKQEEEARLAAEKKEREKALEKVTAAVAELKKIKEKFEKVKDASPENKRQFDRVSHTINAVESSLGQVEKDGPNKGKYKVEMRNQDGSFAKWPDGSQAMQYEGIPVDEMVSILSEHAKEMNKAEEDRRKQLKDNVEKLTYKYIKTDVHEDDGRARKLAYEQLQAARKGLADVEKELNETGGSKEISDLVGYLNKHSKPYFEARYGHGLPLSKEESEKQHLRTQHEAFLMAQDYRAEQGSSPEEAMGKNYGQAMEAMKNRRELSLGEEVAPAKVDVEPVKPAPVDLVPPELKYPSKNKLFSGDITDVGRKLAEMSGDKHLNDLLNAGKAEGGKGFVAAVKNFAKSLSFKNIWTRMKNRAREGFYRQKFRHEAKDKMYGQQELKAEEGSAIGLNVREEQDLNLFINAVEPEKLLAESQAELQALTERFQEGLLMNEGSKTGEKIKTLDAGQQKYIDEINTLMVDYINPSKGASESERTWMSDADFNKRKGEILHRLRKEHPELVDENKLNVDDFLETAREYRKVREHEEGLARLDFKFQIDMGVARSAIKSKSHLEGMNKAFEWIQKLPVAGRIFTPTVLGSAVSVIAYMAQKPAYAFGVGGIAIGAWRRRKELTSDMLMHRAESAAGVEFDESAKRREKLDKYLYSMRNVSDVRTELTDQLSKLNSEKNEANLQAVLENVADIEARMALDDEKQLDLIQYGGTTQIERGRLGLLRSVAEAKLALGADQKEALTQAIAKKREELLKEVKEKDTAFATHRGIQTGIAAVTGGAAGYLIGAGLQEAGAKLSDWAQEAGRNLHDFFQNHMEFLRPGGKQTAIEHFLHLRSGAGLPPGMKHGLDIVTDASGHDISRAQLPAGTHIERSVGGLYNLVSDRNGRVLAEQIKFGPDGAIVSHADRVGLNFTHHLDSRTGRVGLMDHIREHFNSKLTDVKRTDWFRNAKVNVPDHNEWQLRFGGVGGTGFDHDHKFDLDLSHLKENGSWIAEGPHRQGPLDIDQAFKEGRIIVDYVPDDAHPGKVAIMHLDSNMHVTGANPDNELFQSVSSTGGDGRLDFHGKIEVSYLDPDRPGHIYPIATYTGKAPAEVTGEIKTMVNTITPKPNTNWFGPPAILKFRRRPLERADLYGTGKEKQSENSGRNPERNTERPNNPDAPRDFAGEGEQTDLKPKFTSVVYGSALAGELGMTPAGERPKERSDADVAKAIVDTDYYAGADRAAVKDLPEDKKVEYFENKVKAERERIKNAEFAKKVPDYVNKTVEAAKQLNAKYVKDGKIPSRKFEVKNVRVVGSYEFNAIKTTGSAAVADLGSGEILINADIFEILPEEQRIEEITNALFSTETNNPDNNVWTAESESEPGKRKDMLRRSGLVFGDLRRRKDAVSGKTSLVYGQRGVALNRAVNAEFAKEAARNIRGAEFNERNLPQYDAPEQQVLKVLMETKKVDFNLFAEAALNRESLPDLIRALSGEPGSKTGPDRHFFEILLTIMDTEYLAGNREYKKTLSFIKGESVTLTPNMLYRMPGSVMENGDLKKSIKDRYPLLSSKVIQIQQPERQAA